MKEWILENTDIKENTYDEIISHQKSKVDSDEFDLRTTDDVILYALINFTLNKPTRMNCLRWGVKKQGKTYKHQNIKFELFYDFYPDDDLFSTKRIGQCHIKSHAIAFNTSLDIVTALCRDFRNERQDYLHSFLLHEQTNLVLDYTLNLVMNKDDYFKLLNVRPIKTINNKDLKRISTILRANLDIASNIDIKEYLCFPEEIEKALTRFRKQ